MPARRVRASPEDHVLWKRKEGNEGIGYDAAVQKFTCDMVEIARRDQAETPPRLNQFNVRIHSSILPEGRSGALVFAVTSSVSSLAPADEPRTRRRWVGRRSWRTYA